MHHTLTSFKFKYDLAPLKIFINHDNMISSIYRQISSSSIDVLAAVLDNLLQLPSLRRKIILYKTMRQSLRERTSPMRQSFRWTLVSKQLSSEDLEFVNLLNMSLSKIRKFMKPEKLMSLLPKSFTFNNQPTYKIKMLHLLRQLLKSTTDVHSELDFSKKWRLIRTFQTSWRILCHF